MSCQEIFSVEFKNKQFMIFLADNDKITFLEITESGKYEYPVLEDYLQLYKIFNISDPYTLYAVPRLNFDSYVKVAKNGILSLLTIVILANSVPNAMALGADVQVKKDTLVITETYDSDLKKVVNIQDVQDLDKYLGHVDVTEKSILDMIEGNEDLPEDIKEIAKEEFLKIYEMHPTANYRIFYENNKTLKVNVFSAAEYYKRFPTGSAANYDRRTNTINLAENASKALIAHELAHTYDSFYRKLDDVIISRIDKYSAFNEGMKDLMVDYLTPSEGAGAYKISKDVLKFLMYATDYTYEEYSRYGLEELFNRAAKLYLEVDFRYINSTLTAMHRAQIYGLKFSKDMSYFYDELFEVCLSKANKTTGYEPFNKFLYILGNDTSSIDEYFEAYTNRLMKLGYSSEKINAIRENLKTYEKANVVLYAQTDETAICFGYQDENYNLSKIDDKGEQPLTNATDLPAYQSLNPGMMDLFKLKVFTNGKGLKESLVDVLNEDKQFSPHIYTAIPIFMDGKLLVTAMTENLSIQVGFIEDGEIGFVITDEIGNIIHKPDQSLSAISNKVCLNDYLSCYDVYYLEGLELDSILNNDFLKQYQSMSSGFCNFDVEDDEIVPGYSTVITVVSDIYGKKLRNHYKLTNSKVYVKGDLIFPSNLEYDSDDYDYIIDLGNILRYGNILRDDEYYYSISEVELEEMTKNYIQSLNIEEAKKL